MSRIPNDHKWLPKEITDLIRQFVDKRKHPCLFLLTTFVSLDTLFKLMSIIWNNHYSKLDVILTTPGWLGDAAYKIAKFLRDSCDELNIFVPCRAKSAWTFITLSADNICLWWLGELWPLDVQLKEIDENWKIVHKSALEEFKTLEQIKSHTIHTLNEANMLISWSTNLNLKDVIHLSNEFTGQTSWKLYDKVDTKRLGTYSRQLEVWKLYWYKILVVFWKKTPNEADSIVQRLVYWYPTHWFVVDDIECKSMWLNIVDAGNVENEMINLNPVLLQFEMDFEKKNADVDFIELFNYN